MRTNYDAPEYLPPGGVILDERGEIWRTLARPHNLAYNGVQPWRSPRSRDCNYSLGRR